MTAMNWKPLAVRLVLAFTLVMMMSFLPVATEQIRNAAAPRPTRPELRIRDIMLTWCTAQALAAADSPKPATSDENDAKLIAALQKRLLVPNLADITLGPPSPAPLPGITQ